MPFYDTEVVAQVHYRTTVHADSRKEAKDIIIDLLDDHISDSVDNISINWTTIFSERPDSEEEDE